MLKLCNLLDIKHQLASPYHSQTNGLTERFNNTLCQSLAKTAEEHGAEWDRYVAPTLFAYRVKKNETSSYTPFFLVYGREPIIPADL